MKLRLDGVLVKPAHYSYTLILRQEPERDVLAVGLIEHTHSDIKTDPQARRIAYFDLKLSWFPWRKVRDHISNYFSSQLGYTWCPNVLFYASGQGEGLEKKREIPDVVARLLYTGSGWSR